MDSFKYEPLDLDGPAFRLVRLCHGEGPDIYCELFQAWLYPEHSAISYEALSYTWGSTEIVESVRMNGKTLGITQNLYLALQYLRFRDEDRILWVDGICIDQVNDKERGHQVRHMGDIYKQAERVIFWLGQPTYDTNVVLDSLHQLQRESTRHACRTWELSDPRWVNLWLAVQPGLKEKHPDLQSRQRQGLEDLLSRPWFRRIWILQEVANARAALVCCGQRSVSAHIFPLARLLIDVIPNAQCQAVLDIMPGPSRAGTWWNMNRDLYTLLQKFRASEARLPCDMVFALLELSSDAENTDMLTPDYEKSEHDIIHDVVYFLFNDHIYRTQELYFPTLRDLLMNLELLNKLYLQHYMESSYLEDLENILEWRYFGISENDIAVAAHATRIAMSESLEGSAKRTERVESSNRKDPEKALRGGHLDDAGTHIMFPPSPGITMATVFGRSGTGFVGDEEERGGGGETMDMQPIADLWDHLSTLERLLQRQGYKTEITEQLLITIISTHYDRPEVIGFLFKYALYEIKVTDAVLIALLRTNSTIGEAKTTLAQKQGNENKITEAVLEAIVSNTCYGLELFQVLLQQRGNEVQITEGVLRAAISNRVHGLKLVKLILRERADEIHITEGILDATASNSCHDPEIRDVVLEQIYKERKIRDAMRTAVALRASLIYRD